MRITMLSKLGPHGTATIAALLFGLQPLAAADPGEHDNRVRNLAEMWSQASGESFDTLASLFARLDDGRLEAIQAANGMEEVRRLLGARPLDPAAPPASFGLAGQAVGTLSLGDADRDLVYTPVTPCRVVDTRISDAGQIPEGVSRGFKVYGTGTELTPQGGNAAGCPSPRGEPRAVHLNVAHLSSVPSGFLTLYPADLATPPFTGWTNPQDPPQPISNAGTVKTGFLVANDIKVFASNLSDAVIDVLGYYHEADQIDAHFRVLSGLNRASANIDTTYTKIDDYGTFTKARDSTRVEIHVNSRAYSGIFGDGAIAVRFQVRIDDTEPDWGNAAAISTSDTIDFLSIYAVFEDLAPGDHTVSIWARTSRGNSSSVLMDPSGFGGAIILKETL